MKTKAKIYKFSTTDIVQYINQNVDVANSVVRIIKNKVSRIDAKTITKITMVNDMMSKVGEMINVIGEKFNVGEKKYESITKAITQTSTIITMILDDVTAKIIKLALISTIAVPAVIISRLYITGLAWFVKATFRSLGLIAAFKISVLTKTFENIRIIADNLISISKKLMLLGFIAPVSIPLMKTSRLYVLLLGKFMRTVFASFSTRKVIKVKALQIYFDIFNTVADLIIGVTGKLIKLGIVTLLTRWAIKAATKYIIRLSIFNHLVLNLFRKRDLIGMFVMKKYFKIFADVVKRLIVVANQIVKLRLVARMASRSLEKRIYKYIINLSVLNFLILNLFRKRDVISIKIMEIYFKILKNVLTGLFKVAIEVIKLGLLNIISNKLIKNIRVFLIRLRGVIRALKRAFNISVIRLIKIKFKIRLLKGIFNQLILLSIKTIALSVFAILAIPATMLNTVFVTVLATFVKALQLLLRISKIKFKDIFRITLLSIVLGLLILVAGEVIALGALSIIAIPALIINTIFIVGLTIFVKLLQILLKIAKVKAKDLLSLVMIIAMLGLLIVIAFELKKLNDIGEKLYWKNLFMVMGGILAMAGFSILIGLAAMAIVPIIGIAALGLITLLIVIGLIVLIAMALDYIQSIELNAELIDKNINIILGLAENIKSRIFTREENTNDAAIPQTEQEGVTSILSQLGGIGEDIISLLCHFGSLAITLLSVVLIKFVADQLNSLQNIALDRAAIMDVVNIVLDVSRSITDILFDSPDYTPENASDDNVSLVESIIEFVGDFFRPLFGLLKAICAVPVLLSTIISVGMIFVIAKMLNKIMEIDFNGAQIRQKIKDLIDVSKSISDIIFGIDNEQTYNTEYMSTEGRSWFGQGVASIVNGAANLGHQVWDTTTAVGGTMLGAVGDLLSSGAFAAVVPSLQQLSVVVNLLKGVQDLNISNIEATKNTITKVVEIANYVCGTITNGTQGNAVNLIDEDKIDLFEEYVDTSIKYFKSINKLDTSKLRSLGDMYSKMGEFMDKLQDAPIDEIADALVNKISPALNSINNSIGRTQTAGTTASTTTSTTTPSTSTSTTNNNYYNGDQNKSIDYTGILENIEDLLEEIKLKLNAQPQPAF